LALNPNLLATQIVIFFDGEITIAWANAIFPDQIQPVLMKPSCPLGKSNLLASTSQFGWSMLVKFPNFWPPLGLHMSAMLRLYYFPLMAKGLGPALVAELSGLPWLGPKDLGFTRDDWPKLKDWSLESGGGGFILGGFTLSLERHGR